MINGYCEYRGDIMLRNISEYVFWLGGATEEGLYAEVEENYKVSKPLFFKWDNVDLRVGESGAETISISGIFNIDIVKIRSGDIEYYQVHFPIAYSIYSSISVKVTKDDRVSIVTL